MPTFTLRPYQKELLQKIAESFDLASRVLLQLPTGGGKTVVFCEIVKSFLTEGKTALIVVHRKELLDQASRSLSRLGIDHGLICPGEKVAPGQKVAVASVQSLPRKSLPFEPDLLIIDEAHHAAGKNNWTKAIDRWPAAKILGVTATPCRLDGKPLGKIFQLLIQGPQSADLINQGFLAPARVFSPKAQVTTEGITTRAGDYNQAQISERFDTEEITQQALENFSRICPDAKSIVFCCSIQHAENVSKAFSASGISSGCLHGKLTKQERGKMLSEFASGDIQVITSRDIISEGTDIPDAESAILIRPTQSESLYLQQVGRVLRTAPNKRYAVIIDLVSNTVTHGLPDENRDWSISLGLKKNRKRQVFTCSKCDAVLTSSQKTCSHCGEPNPNYKTPSESIEILDTRPEAEIEIEELNLQDITELCHEIIHREIRLNPRRSGMCIFDSIYMRHQDNEIPDGWFKAWIDRFRDVRDYISDSRFALPSYASIEQLERLRDTPIDLISAGAEFRKKYGRVDEMEAAMLGMSGQKPLTAQEKLREDLNEKKISKWTYELYMTAQRAGTYRVISEQIIEWEFMNCKETEEKYGGRWNNSYSRYKPLYKIYMAQFFSRHPGKVKIEDLRFLRMGSEKLLTFWEMPPLLQLLIDYYLCNGQLCKKLFDQKYYREYRGYT